jgi:polyhydroxybutyrate depolymerase
VAKDARPAVLSVIQQWRTTCQCGPATMTHTGIVHVDNARGPGGVEVTLITIDGAGHQWPGGRPAPPRAARMLGIDPPTTAVDATATLWQFFAAHPRPPGPR